MITLDFLNDLLAELNRNTFFGIKISNILYSFIVFLFFIISYICGFKYVCGVSNSPARMEQLPGLDTAARMEQLPGWNNYLGSILRLGWNNYLDGTTTWVRTCVLRPLGHSLYQLSYVEHLLLVPIQKIRYS